MSETNTQPASKSVQSVVIRHHPPTKTYDVTVDICDFRRGAYQNDMFYVWLLQRFQDETVRFSFTRTDAMAGCAEAYITFLNVVRLCPARTIAKVDHMHEGISAWAAICCDDLEISDFGMLQFQPITSRDGKTTDLDAQTKAVADFIFFLYATAIDRGWMTTEELENLADGGVVFITPDVLKQRTS